MQLLNMGYMNKPKEKSISWVFIWQTAGRFILQGISFFTAPVFTRLLTPSDYGQVAVYGTWVSLCTLFIGLETHGSIANAKVKYNDDKINAYLSSIMTISVISFIVVLGGGIVANKFFAKILNLRSDLVILLIIQSFASFSIAFYTAKLIQYKQAERSALLSLLVSVSSTALAIIFLLSVSENRYIVKIYANAIPTIIIGLVIVYFVFSKGRRVDKAYWNFCLALTLPLILHGAGGLVLSQSDRIMLQRMSGESDAGIYRFAYNVALVISVLWMSFNTTWIPFYYEYKKNNRKTLLLLRAKNYITIFTILTMGFILLAPEVYRVMAPQEYWSGIVLIPLIAMAYYFNFLYSFPASYEFYNAKTKLISIGTICAAIINIVCNLIFIPLYAGTGAAIATLISFAFLFIVHEIIARFVIQNYDYKFTIYLKGLVPVVAVSAIFYVMQDFWYIRWGLGAVLGIYLLRRIIKNQAIF
jgi:O-antigen/teichoic acid export membrane protein